MDRGFGTLQGVICILLACLFVTEPARGDLTINLIFGEGFDGPNAELQREVVRAAADYWEATIQTDFTVDIVVNQVDLKSIGAGILGRMHSNLETQEVNPETQTRLPESAYIELAANRLDDFYFDPTPYSNEEYDLDARGVGPAIGNGPPGNRFDALTVWIHEIGHVMGFAGATGTFADGMPFFAFTDFADNLDAAGDYEFDWLVGGSEGNMGDTVPMLDPFHISFLGPDGFVASLNPSIAPGLRRLITPIDANVVGDAFHLEINDAPFFPLGDVNCDGRIDLLDVDPFVEVMITGQFVDKADINLDGGVDLLDVNPFVGLLVDQP